MGFHFPVGSSVSSLYGNLVNLSLVEYLWVDASGEIDFP